MIVALRPEAVTRRTTRDDEVADLERVALAGAGLGDNHRWQDLQFSSRGEISALMRCRGLTWPGRGSGWLAASVVYIDT